MASPRNSAGPCWRKLRPLSGFFGFLHRVRSAAWKTTENTARCESFCTLSFKMPVAVTRGGPVHRVMWRYVSTASRLSNRVWSVLALTHARSRVLAGSCLDVQ